MNFEDAMQIAEVKLHHAKNEQKDVIVGGLITAIGTILSIWESKEKTKYADALRKLKQEDYDERSKIPHSRATLDDIRYRLLVLNEAIATAARTTNL